MSAADPPAPTRPAPIDELADHAGLRRVRVIAWRDLDHPSSGGSEVHVNRLASLWAAAGLDVSIRTGTVKGLPKHARRGGYQVERVGGPVGTLVRTPLHDAVSRRHDALVEVWHGINFLAPLWARVPTLGIAHHVHSGQFGMVLPRPAAAVAEALERRVYPRVYRRTPLVTLSASARDELIRLGYRRDGVAVVPPGVDRRFTPGGARATEPLLLVVARLMPQKRVDVVLRAAAALRAGRPGLDVVVVGEGPERQRLEEENRFLGGVARFVGRVSDDELVEWYRRAWILVSASLFEGWGMIITEAAACGTPAVVSDISGHRDAVVHGTSGILVAEGDLERALASLLDDADERRRLTTGAVDHAGRFRWEEAARATFEVLAREAARRR